MATSSTDVLLARTVNSFRHFLGLADAFMRDAADAARNGDTPNACHHLDDATRAVESAGAALRAVNDMLSHGNRGVVP